MRLRQELMERPSERGMPSIRSHLQGGHEGKSTLVESSMGNPKSSVADPLVPKQEDVEVEGTVRPAHPRTTPKACLNALAGCEELAGRARGVNPNGSIEEQLARSPHRDRLPDSTDRNNLNVWEHSESLYGQAQQHSPISQRAAQSNDSRQIGRAHV